MQLASKEKTVSTSVPSSPFRSGPRLGSPAQKVDPLDQEKPPTLQQRGHDTLSTRKANKKTHLRPFLLDRCQRTHIK
jgi:hypothetical protein